MSPTDPIAPLQAAPRRLAVMVSGGGTTMQNLAEVIARGELNAEIVCCIASNNACFAIERAKHLNIPLEIISRKESGSLETFSEKITAALTKYHTDLALMAGYLSLWRIPPEFAGKVLNIHPALLPKFGGKGMHGEHVHAAVLAAGETESGCTVHYADNEYDHGPIILQRRVPVLPGDTAEMLAKRVFTAECLAYPEAVRWVAENVLVREGENVFLRKVVAYITRERGGKKELLVFDHVHHPEAGTQVPHGTVHVGEQIESAILREAAEETGLQGLTIRRKLGIAPWKSRTWGISYERHFFELAAPADAPETWDWYETDGGKKPLLPDFLFRFRWVQLGPHVSLAGGEDAFLRIL